MPGCDLRECEGDATHYVVYGSDGEDWREEYCKPDAELAAREARDDPFGELVAGPEPI